MQERIAETDRIKKESTCAAKEKPIENHHCLFSGLGGVTLVSSKTDPKEKLGLVRGSANVTKRPTVGMGTAGSVPRANSVDQTIESIFDNSDPFACTTFLTDSKTITIPISGSQPYVPTTVPEYKTMPSPSRTNNDFSGNTSPAGLNEIFEETTDIGSSDSAATTPRSLTRHAHFAISRSHNSGSPSATTSTRRSKFHKTRTASCSSSDASDDDSENRKKRAHKIVDSTKPIQQRRDSYDDSSDSQDPGTGTSASTSSSLYPIQMVVGNYPEEQRHTKDTNGGGNSSSNGRQKSGQQMGFRRHRAGRRRAGETRLRESQSLNRITEVQESEPSTTSMSGQHNKVGDHAPPTSVPPTVVHHKARGFSARLFQGFRKSDGSGMVASALPATLIASELLQPKAPIAAEEEVEMALGVELAKALKVTTESKGSSTSKKLKMLGRYFQVICNLFYYAFTYST